MNFKTRQSYNNKLLFVYASGEVKQTVFTEVAFYGDNYLLAKGSGDLFYTLLDLDGNTVDGYNVVHRFENGLLLTYHTYNKQYVSSDKFAYAVNYNIYSVVNFAMRKSYVVNIIQSESLLGQKYTAKVLEDKTRKTVIKDFLNKPVYCFNDFVFSEMMDNQYLITGTLLSVNPKMSNPAEFDIFKHKKIWGVVDILRQKSHEGQTSMEETALCGITFNEAETYLSGFVTTPQEPMAEDFDNQHFYMDAVSEYNLYSSWRKKGRWQKMLGDLMPFAKN